MHVDPMEDGVFMVTIREGRCKVERRVLCAECALMSELWPGIGPVCKRTFKSTRLTDYCSRGKRAETEGA